MNISDMGFLPGRILEAIVTTYNEDLSPNAAPIGIYPLGESEIRMDVHEPSDTRENILRNRNCVVNMVFDPILFLKCAILGNGKREKENEISPREIILAKNVDAPVIKEANAWIELKLRESTDIEKNDAHGTTNVSRVVCSVEDITVNKKYPIAINRGLYAAIETAVAKSRGMDVDKRHIDIMERTLAPEEFAKIKELL